MAVKLSKLVNGAVWRSSWPADFRFHRPRSFPPRIRKGPGKNLRAPNPVPELRSDYATNPPRSQEDDPANERSAAHDEGDFEPEDASGWAWKENVDDDLENEFVNEARLVDNPLVRRFQHGRRQTDISGGHQPLSQSSASIQTEETREVDAVALQLLFQLMETSKHRRPSMLFWLSCPILWLRRSEQMRWWFWCVTRRRVIWFPAP